MFLAAGDFSIPSAYTVLLFLFSVSQGSPGLKNKCLSNERHGYFLFVYCISKMLVIDLFSHPCSAAKVR